MSSISHWPLPKPSCFPHNGNMSLLATDVITPGYVHCATFIIHQSPIADLEHSILNLHTWMNFSGDFFTEASLSKLWSCAIAFFKLFFLIIILCSNFIFRPGDVDHTQSVVRPHSELMLWYGT